MPKNFGVIHSEIEKCEAWSRFVQTKYLFSFCVLPRKRLAVGNFLVGHFQGSFYHDTTQMTLFPKVPESPFFLILVNSFLVILVNSFILCFQWSVLQIVIQAKSFQMARYNLYLIYWACKEVSSCFMALILPKKLSHKVKPACKAKILQIFLPKLISCLLAAKTIRECYSLPKLLGLCGCTRDVQHYCLA